MMAFVASACSSPDSEDISGVWVTPGYSIHMSFNEDGSWYVVHPEDPERIRGSGTFTFDGGLLTISTDPGAKNCSRITGTSEAALAPESNLELTDVDDPCTLRRVDLRGQRTNTDLPHSTGTLVPYSP
jgi:hypothetical protein